MIQEIIVYTILIITFGLTFYKMIGFFEVFKENSTKSACSTCSSGACGSCAVKAIKDNPSIIHPIKVDHEKLNF